MAKAHQKSFLIILALIFLLPLFFIPGGSLFLESAKSALFLFGGVAALLVFFYELWQEGSLAFPKHLFLSAVLALPLAYLLSALLSTPTSLSLFGYAFEVGTFGYILVGALFLALSSLIFADATRLLQALVAFFLSLSLIAVFVAAKVLMGGEALVWGNFLGNMSNPLGNWTDLGVAFGLLALFSVLSLRLIPMRQAASALLYAVFLLSTALLLIINFSTALVLTLAGATLLFFYFLKVESRYLLSDAAPAQQRRRTLSLPALLPLILALACLLFLIDPTISETQGTLGNVVARTFGIENAEVRPSFSATLDVSKAVLMEGAFLGSGPNTFSQDWLIYKPADINTTPFWSVAFPFGVGFIPTQIASTGILGTALWLAFFALLLLLVVKVLIRLPESRPERFTVIGSLFVTLFLWTASFLYAPSATMLWLAFVFSGLFIAALSHAQVLSSRVIDWKISPQSRLVARGLLVLAVIGTVFLGWTGFEKTAAAYHWKRAIDLANVSGTPLTQVENQLIKAIERSPADIHYVALSRLNFAKAQAAASATSSSEQVQAIFEDSVRRSIEAARLAVALNSSGYGNWVALGFIYRALVPPPLSIEGAYENALFAFNEALKRNPNNPELYLMLAQLELNKGDAEAARGFVRNAIILKPDYVDAYLMLAQLEVVAGNTEAAIASAEQLAALVPSNPGLHLELGILKYSAGDYSGAERDINRSLMLAPDYANAKYYLGLTLIELGRLAEARSEFESLALSNPDNPDVERILESLRAGRRPPLER